MNPIIFPITYRCNLHCEYCKEYKKPDITNIKESLDIEWSFIILNQYPLMTEADCMGKFDLAGHKLTFTKVYPGGQ